MLPSGNPPQVAEGLAGKIRERISKRETPTAPHLIVEARAGTGKTTTLVEGLKRVKGLESSLVPSPQQARVWEAMAESRDAKTICFVAFNKSIATELQRRVPQGCDAMTMHSMGYKAVRKAFASLREPNQSRVQEITAELLGRDVRELRRFKMELLKAVDELVSLCKMNLTDVTVRNETRGNQDLDEAQAWADALDALAAHYDVELNGSREQVYSLVPRVLERCKDVGKDQTIDFNDMIWLPVAMDLPLPQYDLLLIDESQDLNRCQQELALRVGRRLILCGDPKQAIYGFAGADDKSMGRMEEILRATPAGVQILPLTVTRRCGKAIVVEAQKIVPDFEAFPENGAGKISQMPFLGEQNYSASVLDGDFILCRVNAPLVSQCFRFIKAGRKANIQGRDIGKGLASTVKKLKAGDVVDLITRLDDWRHEEVRKEQAKRNPSEQRLIALQDRYDCLLCFTEGAKTVDDVLAKIESIFTDNKDSAGIRLSSIHRAKGLESRRVFFLMPKGGECPHAMARSAWQKSQEMNLLYVGITRAIEELIYVR